MDFKISIRTAYAAIAISFFVTPLTNAEQAHHLCDEPEIVDTCVWNESELKNVPPDIRDKFSQIYDLYNSTNSIDEPAFHKFTSNIYIRIVPLLRNLISDYPKEELFQRALRDVLYRMGENARSKGDFKASIADYNECISITKKLMEKYPNNLLYKIDDLINLYSLGKVPGAPVTWIEIRRRAVELNQEGILRGRYLRLLADARVLANERPFELPSASEVQVHTVTEPSWLITPERSAHTVADIHRVGHASGHVVLYCRVLRTGYTTQCEIVEETPINNIYVGAALRASENFRLHPELIDGLPTDYGTVYIPVNFK